MSKSEIATIQPEDKSQSADEIYPVLPLRDVVVYPHMVIPLFVGREKSINALEASMNALQKIFWCRNKRLQMKIHQKTTCSQ